jgi:uncharacterized protein (TIGR02300 family)
LREGPDRWQTPNWDPIHCPKCGAVYEVVVATRPVRPAGPVTTRPPVPEEAPVPEPQEVETVSLEEADSEAQGAAKKPAPAEAGIEEEAGVEEKVEMDESHDDNTLIKEQEGEDADVTDIISGDIENKEDG